MFKKISIRDTSDYKQIIYYYHSFFFSFFFRKSTVDNGSEMKNKQEKYIIESYY